MAIKRTVPVFSSEDEEAQWWFDHRDDFARDFEQALADGTEGVGTIAKRMQDAEDAADAKHQPVA